MEKQTPGIGTGADTGRVRRDISHTAKQAGRDDDGKECSPASVHTLAVKIMTANRGEPASKLETVGRINLNPDEPDNDPGRQSRDEPST